MFNMGFFTFSNSGLSLAMITMTTLIPVKAEEPRLLHPEITWSVKIKCEIKSGGKYKCLIMMTI